MVALVQERFGFKAGDRSVAMVGDQPGTDGRLAQRLGLAFGLVDSGVTQPGTATGDVPVAQRAPDFEHLVAEALSGVD
jgi:ribonucleotide monophosphatase NagD (HAD superfamily)